MEPVPRIGQRKSYTGVLIPFESMLQQRNKLAIIRKFFQWIETDSSAESSILRLLYVQFFSHLADCLAMSCNLCTIVLKWPFVLDARVLLDTSRLRFASVRQKKTRLEHNPDRAKTPLNLSCYYVYVHIRHVVLTHATSQRLQPHSQTRVKQLVRGYTTEYDAFVRKLESQQSTFHVRFLLMIAC